MGGWKGKGGYRGGAAAARHPRPGPPPSPPPSCVSSSFPRPPYAGFCFVPIRPPALDVVTQIQDEIPDEWLERGHGVRDPTPNAHVTLLLSVTNHYGEALDGLTRVASQTPAFTLKLSQLSVERVDRITDRPVFCIVAVADSPELPRLRATCMKTVESYVRYEGPGHLSIAYVKGRYEGELRRFLTARKATFEAVSSPVSQICLDLPQRDGDRHYLSLKEVRQPSPAAVASAAPASAPAPPPAPAPVPAPLPGNGVVEVRRDGDGQFYSLASFCSEYGDAEGPRRWAAKAATAKLGAPGDGEQERRIDKADGKAYTEQSFCTFYGEQDGAKRWGEAGPEGAREPTDASSDWT